MTALFEHQKYIVSQAKLILDEFKLVMLALEPRVGKSLIALELLRGYNSVLVITKKNALKGWNETLALFEGEAKVTVINYEQAHKLNESFDAIVLDESHSKLSSFPKRTKMQKAIQLLCMFKPIVFCTATPAVETILQYYHQLTCSSFHRWSFNFKGREGGAYEFFRKYGIASPLMLHGRMVETYKKANYEAIMEGIQPYLVTMTQSEAGFEQPVRIIEHNVSLTRDVEAMMKEFERELFVEWCGHEIEAETVISKLQKLHQISGGTVKLEDGSVFLHHSKVDYIRTNFKKKTVVFTNYIAERELIIESLDGCTSSVEEFLNGGFNYFVGSIKSYSEGVSFAFDSFGAEIPNLVLYSLSWSGTTYIQCIQRLSHPKRVSQPLIHVLLASKVDRSVFKAISSKKDFNSRLYV